MWASSATALYTAEPPLQQECHRQSEGKNHCPTQSPTCIAESLSNCVVLISLQPPKPAHFANTEKSSNISTSYTELLELQCPTESALGTFPTNYWSQSFCFEMPCLEQGRGAFSGIFCRAWGRSQYCTKPKSYFKYGVKVPCGGHTCGWCETGCNLSRFWKEL